MRAFALATTLLGFVTVGQVSATTAPTGFTLLYSADERGEIEPCG